MWWGNYHMNNQDKPKLKTIWLTRTADKILHNHRENHFIIDKNDDKNILVDYKKETYYIPNYVVKSLLRLNPHLHHWKIGAILCYHFQNKSSKRRESEKAVFIRNDYCDKQVTTIAETFQDISKVIKNVSSRLNAIENRLDKLEENAT